MEERQQEGERATQLPIKCGSSRTNATTAFLVGLVIVALLAAIAVFSLYRSHFDGAWAPAQNTWGEFGDYFGGVLNPILTFITLIALVWALRLQSNELEATRYELYETRIANKRAAAALEQQKSVADAQLEQLKLEEHKEDLIRVIERVWKDLQLALDEGVTLKLKPTHPKDAQPNYINISPNKFIAMVRDENAAYEPILNDPTNEYVLTPLRELIFELEGLLVIFEKLAATDHVTYYYKRRVWKWLPALSKTLVLPEGVLEFFSPDPQANQFNRLL